MSALPKSKLTVAEYLTLEALDPWKNEYRDGQMIAMERTTIQHNIVKDNLIGELGNRLKIGPCRTLSSRQRVKVERTGLYTYPDVLILCERPICDTVDPDSILNPCAIIEVLSPASARYDRTTKFRHYQQIATMCEYVLVSQDEALIEQFVRQDDDTWKYFSFVGLEANFQLATVTATPIPMADIYRGVTLATDIR